MSEADAHSARYSRRYRIVSQVIFVSTLICLAWYAWSSHKLLKEYQQVRDKFGMTDAEMADFGAHQQEYLAAMKRQDEMAAGMALGALIRLDRGDVEQTRHVLEQTVSIYYRGHRQDGDSNVIRHIEAFAATNTSLSNAIYRPLE